MIPMAQFDPTRSKAVLVGISAYDHLPDLPAVANNLVGLREVLTDPTLGGMDPADCAVLPADADPVAIGRAIAAAEQARDMLLVYFSGHGMPGAQAGQLLLALKGTDPDLPEYSSLPYDAVRGQVVRSGARVRVLIMDCCFSGRAVGPYMSAARDLVAELEINGTFVLTASPANQVAISGAAYSEFTGELLAILRDGIPGTQRLLTVEAIYRRLRQVMLIRNLPEPQLLNTGTAEDLALAPNRAYLAPNTPAESEEPTGRVLALGSLGTNPDAWRKPSVPELATVDQPFRARAVTAADFAPRLFKAEETTDPAEQLADYLDRVAEYCLGVADPTRLPGQHPEWAGLLDRARTGGGVAEIDHLLDRAYRALPRFTGFAPVGGGFSLVLLRNRLAQRWAGFSAEYLAGIARFCEPPLPVGGDLSADLVQRLPDLADPLHRATELYRSTTSSVPPDQDRVPPWFTKAIRWTGAVGLAASIASNRTVYQQFADNLDRELEALVPITDEIETILRALIAAGRI
ncbi:Caspase domain-containing protein [Actinokineospora globicatena]|nr:Caspase domain-containing protein [Actinokineospora globicatena]